MMTDEDREIAILMYERIGEDTGNNKIINKFKRRCLFNTGPFVPHGPDGKALPFELQHNPQYQARVNGWQEVCAWMLQMIKEGEKRGVSEDYKENNNKKG